MAKQAAAQTHDDGEGGTEAPPTTATKTDVAAKPATPAKPLPPAVAAVVAKPRVLVAANGRLEDILGIRNHWHAAVDPGTTQADLERAEFWQNYGKVLKVKDRVEARCVDGSFVADLYVIAVGPLAVQMKCLGFWELDPIAPGTLNLPTGYSVDWGGDIAKWRARRGAEVVKEGFEAESTARRWLGNYIASVNR